MALLTRITRLFRADMHAVLDRVEEPGVLLRQAIREMEEAQASDERHLRLAKQDGVQLDARITDLEHSLEQIAEQLELCFTAGKDELARTLIRRRLESQMHLRFLTGKRNSHRDRLDTLAAQLQENRNRLEAMRQKAELLGEDDAPGAPEERWRVPDFSVCEADVEVAFLREKQRRNPS